MCLFNPLAERNISVVVRVCVVRTHAQNMQLLYPFFDVFNSAISHAKERTPHRQRRANKPIRTSVWWGWGLLGVENIVVQAGIRIYYRFFLDLLFLGYLVNNGPKYGLRCQNHQYCTTCSQRATAEILNFNPNPSAKRWCEVMMYCYNQRCDRLL